MLSRTVIPQTPSFAGYLKLSVAGARLAARAARRGNHSTAFTMSSTTFFASPNTIIVLSM